MDKLLKEEKDGILILQINRPDALNALDADVIHELGEIFLNDLRDFPQVRVVVLTGIGDKAFAAGADIKAFPSMAGQAGQALSRAGHEVFRAMETCRVPIIGMVNGFALGGGCELLMRTHLRIAEEHAKFGQPEINLGLIPGYGGSVLLKELIGKTRAMYMLLTGKMIDAKQAEDWGLVNTTVPKGEGLANALMLASKLKANAPLAMAEMIKLMDMDDRKSALEEEMVAFGRMFDTDDMKEGVDAFINKRKPTFNGK